GTEVCAYFDHVMQRQFLPSGRVQYFPMCEYQGDRRFTSIVSGEAYEVKVNKKTVDATYMNVTVPSVRGPSYEVADGVQCMPLNDLPKVKQPPAGYVVVGAGKTGMDASLWLLANQVDPDMITWIMPRDSWLLDRAIIQPGSEFLDSTLGGIAKQMQAVAESESMDEMFDAVCAAGQLLQFDKNVRPTMYRCATVTKAELEQLRRIKNIVRKGRVKRIGQTEIVLDQGRIPTSTDVLHVDCSADGLERRPVAPIFDGDKMTLQTVRTCQQVFSAAFIAHVEAAYDDEAHKNQLCTVVPHPNTDLDWMRTTLSNAANGAIWAQDPNLQAWLKNARLDGFSQVGNSDEMSPEAQEKQKEAAAALEQYGMPAAMKLQKYLAEAGAAAS
ncbi:MAG: NAD(P)/FAD-dependent oxidoreductase, partial [Pseudomonadota bacterium]